MNQIHVDYNASTPVVARVAAVMRQLLENSFGNPSSLHWAAIYARAAMERARDQVATFLGCAADEVVFTSGGNAANNLAIRGVFFAHRDRGDHVITSAIEHPAILEPIRFLERLGAQVTYLPVDSAGRVDPEDLRKAITPRTLLRRRTRDLALRGSGVFRNRAGPLRHGHPTSARGHARSPAVHGAVPLSRRRHGGVRGRGVRRGAVQSLNMMTAI
jgi:hypothetical protein